MLPQKMFDFVVTELLEHFNTIFLFNSMLKAFQRYNATRKCSNYNFVTKDVSSDIFATINM